MATAQRKTHADTRHASLVADACRHIETSDAIPRVAELAARAGLAERHFHRIFKQLTGVTPHAYAQAIRWDRARRKLAQNTTVTDAMHAAGFESSARFYADSSARLGMTPKRHRAGGRGETIHFALGKCSLGSVLVAESARGVCSIMLGDDPDELLLELQRRFAAAELVGADRGYEKHVAQVVSLVESPGNDANLPLDIRGTAFQQRVWQALRAIPVGETASYAEIARRIGKPGSARAVARACADNKLALAIPCHRVVRSDGGLSGYRWGVERKRALLQRESALRDRAGE
ncbi:MAG: methylated-DNA--[protein]-cysteine S-methyltransferase [Rhodanobacteraceae bacterium]